MFTRFIQTGGAEIAINVDQVRYVRAIDAWTTAVVLGTKGDEEFALSVDEPLLQVLRMLDPAEFTPAGALQAAE